MEKNKRRAIKASDYYFIEVFEDEYTYFAIVSKQFWKENECIKDSSISSEIEHLLPKDEFGDKLFREVMESHFVYIDETEDSDKAKFLLIEAGFEEMENPF